MLPYCITNIISDIAELAASFSPIYYAIFALRRRATPTPRLRLRHCFFRYYVSLPPPLPAAADYFRHFDIAARAFHADSRYG
jgi:hypothetical protein